MSYENMRNELKTQSMLMKKIFVNLLNPKRQLLC
jgi:hypothetical protein